MISGLTCNANFQVISWQLFQAKNSLLNRSILSALAKVFEGGLHSIFQALQVKLYDLYMKKYHK